MAAGEQIAGLLADLQTIADTARAGVISKRDVMLEPGEKRPAAILFVDIVGFTELARGLPSDVLAKVVDRMFRIFELTVRAHGGYCDKVIGDAALYVFAGHPNYPPVCEAALKAALKLEDRLAQVNASLSETAVRLFIRQGVAFGNVTRQAVGAEHAQLTVMGDTVNQAQRLQASAQPGAIQTTIRVLEKAGDAFSREKLGQVELKGIGKVSVYCVTGVEEQPVQLRGAFRHLSPLTGREAELEQAVAQIGAWLQTRYPPETWDITKASTPLQGRNRLLILRGVPAVGKSRLAYELVERLRSWSAGVPARDSNGGQGRPPSGRIVSATAHCAENAMLAQFTAELARVAGLTAENLPRHWEELCANAAQAVSPEYAERQRGHLRLLAYVLGCKAIDAAAIGQADPKSFAISCQLAIRACCELAAHVPVGAALVRPDGDPPEKTVGTSADPTKTPVLLIIEDLQWLGGLKDVLADVMARACLPLPLVAIGTARPEYTPGDEELRELVGAKPCFAQDETPPEEGEARLRPYRIIELGALSRAQGGALVQALLPGLALPDAVAEELHEKAAGIPYFYEDFVRMLVRRGLVVPVGAALVPPGAEASTPAGRTSAAPAQAWRLAADIVALDIPDDLQTLMLGRLDQLDSDVRELARRASVLGHSFQRDLLAAIERRLGFTHEGHPDDDLRAMLSERLLASAPGDQYFFEHALLRQAAYGSLLTQNRLLLHRLAAEILAGLYIPGAAGELEVLEQLVGHLEASGQYMEAHERSCKLMVKLGLHGKVAASERERLRAESTWQEVRKTGGSTAAESAVLLLSLARLAYRSASVEDVTALCWHALALGQQVGNLKTQADCLDWLGAVAQDCDDFASARQYYARSGYLAREASWFAGEINSLCNLSWLRIYDDDYHETLTGHLRALQLARENNDDKQVLEVLLALIYVCALAGQHDQAEQCAAEALEISAKLGDVYGTSVIYCNLAASSEMQGDLNGAIRHEMKVISVLNCLGDHVAEAKERARLGSIYTKNGMLNDAERELETARQQLYEIDNEEGLAYVSVFQAALCARLGDLIEAKAKLDSACGIKERLGLGPKSPIGVEITKARAAIIGFARERGREADVTDLVADHEREQAELARLRAGRDGAQLEGEDATREGEDPQREREGLC
jgi:class 3 adenylate cyclase/tetratricopeptide (TPR) repeat protein